MPSQNESRVLPTPDMTPRPVTTTTWLLSTAMVTAVLACESRDQHILSQELAQPLTPTAFRTTAEDFSPHLAADWLCIAMHSIQETSSQLRERSNRAAHGGAMCGWFSPRSPWPCRWRTVLTWRKPWAVPSRAQMIQPCPGTKPGKRHGRLCTFFLALFSRRSAAVLPGHWHSFGPFPLRGVARHSHCNPVYNFFFRRKAKNSELVPSYFRFRILALKIKKNLSILGNHHILGRNVLHTRTGRRRGVVKKGKGGAEDRGPFSQRKKRGKWLQVEACRCHGGGLAESGQGHSHCATTANRDGFRPGRWPVQRLVAGAQQLVSPTIRRWAGGCTAATTLASAVAAGSSGGVLSKQGRLSPHTERGPSTKMPRSCSGSRQTRSSCALSIRQTSRRGRDRRTGTLPSCTRRVRPRHGYRRGEASSPWTWRKNLHRRPMHTRSTG